MNINSKHLSKRNQKNWIWIASCLVIGLAFWVFAVGFFCLFLCFGYFLMLKCLIPLTHRTLASDYHKNLECGSVTEQKRKPYSNFKTPKEHNCHGSKNNFIKISFTCCSAVSDVLMFCISSFFLFSCSSSCSKNFIFSSWSFSWSSATKLDSAVDSAGGLKRKCLGFKFAAYTEPHNTWNKHTHKKSEVYFETLFLKYLVSTALQLSHY